MLYSYSHANKAQCCCCCGFEQRRTLVHEKHASKKRIPLGISNSNLASLIIGIQQSRRVKNKKMSKFRLSSTLKHVIVNLNQQEKNLLSVLVFVTVFSFLSFTSLF